MIRADMKYDVRTLKHRLRRNEITQAEYEAHLAELADDTDEYEETEVVFTASYAERQKEEPKEP